MALIRHVARTSLGTIFRGNVAMVWACAAASLVPAGTVRGHHPVAPAKDVDRRIVYYLDKLIKDPNLYPVHAQLGRAYLTKAGTTFDSAYIAKARESLDDSLKIQPNFEAYLGHVEVANYAHRFEDALKWAALALEAAPWDTAVIAKMVEARLGLGDVDTAEQLLDQPGLPADDFYLTASRGHVLAAREKPDAAAEAFARAAKIAKDQKADDLANWALIRAAAVMLEVGKTDGAAAYLEKLAETPQPSTDFLLQRGRVAEANGQWSEALGFYESALQKSEDPTIHARLSLAARKLGDVERARRHFDLAEQAFRKVLDSGEIYSLGALARLYLEANTDLSGAAELARRNLEFVRDRESLATLKAIEAKLRPSP